MNCINGPSDIFYIKMAREYFSTEKEKSENGLREYLGCPEEDWERVKLINEVQLLIQLNIIG